MLSAAAAFGKTVVCSYLIARRRGNTLILLESTDLISQWEEERNRFLKIDEEVCHHAASAAAQSGRRENRVGTHPRECS